MSKFISLDHITSVADYEWFTTTRLLIAILFTAIISYAFQIVSGLFFSALRHIPGPVSAKISSFPLLRQTITQEKCNWIHGLFQKYGPVVRVSPNMVVTNDPAAINDIYKNPRVLKSKFYEKFAVVAGELACVSIIDPHKAMTRRRCYLPLVSRKNLVDFAPHIYEHLEEFMLRLDEHEAKGKPVEAVTLWRYLTFDVVTHMAFSGKFGMLKSSDETPQYIIDVDNATRWGFLKGSLPLVEHLPDSLLPSAWKVWRDSEEVSCSYPRTALERWKGHKASGDDELRPVDVIDRLMVHGEKNPDEKLSENEIVSAIQEIMFAGSDTTSTAAMFTCWELAKHPGVQEKLYQELSAAFPRVDRGGYSKEKLEIMERCKYFEAVRKEIFRMHPSILTALERVVPPEGMQISGKFIPGGTVVGMQALSQGLREDIFPEPRAFKPERWLNQTPDMQENLLIFSTGHRGCLGKPLATMQLVLSLGTVLREYRVTLHPETTEESMRMIDGFTTRPVSNKCLLYFHKRPTEV